MIAVGTIEGNKATEPTTEFVVHPMFDAPEEKFTGENLGLIKMSRSVKISLIALRAYLIVMTVMLSYHLLDMAGCFGAHVAR